MQETDSVDLALHEIFHQIQAEQREFMAATEAASLHASEDGGEDDDSSEEDNEPPLYELIPVGTLVEHSFLGEGRIIKGKRDEDGKILFEWTRIRRGQGRGRKKI